MENVMIILYSIGRKSYIIYMEYFDRHNISLEVELILKCAVNS